MPRKRPSSWKVHELSANDWQERVSEPYAPGHDGRRGVVHDRTVELLVHTPFSFASWVPLTRVRSRSRHAWRRWRG